MAFTLHFQRSTQSLWTGEGIGMGGQGFLPGLPWDPVSHSPKTPISVLGALRKSSSARASSNRVFCSKVGECCRSSAPPPTWGAARRGRKRVASAG